MSIGSTGGIVWAAENSNPAVLHGYDATNLAHELYNSNQAANGRDHLGAGNKFITPPSPTTRCTSEPQAGLAFLACWDTEAPKTKRPGIAFNSALRFPE